MLDVMCIVLTENVAIPEPRVGTNALDDIGDVANFVAARRADRDVLGVGDRFRHIALRSARRPAEPPAAAAFVQPTPCYME